MPLTSAKIEVGFCLDARHAQYELEMLADALAVEDTRLHAEVTGEGPPTHMLRPQMVIEVDHESPGLWKGRLIAKFSDSED